MDVRALDAELHDVKAVLELPHCHQRLANRSKHLALAKAADVRMRTHDHVHGLALPEELTLRVPLARARPFLGSANASAPLALSGASKLVVLVESLRIRGEARLDVPLSGSPRHRSSLPQRFFASTNNADIFLLISKRIPNVDADDTPDRT